MLLDFVFCVVILAWYGATSLPLPLPLPFSFSYHVIIMVQQATYLEVTRKYDWFLVVPMFTCKHKACPSRPCGWRCEFRSEMVFCHVNCVQNCGFRLPSLPPTSATLKKVSETRIFDALILSLVEKQQKLAVGSLFRLPALRPASLGWHVEKARASCEKVHAWQKSAA